jgi:opacity protein-like surface antigen
MRLRKWSLCLLLLPALEAVARPDDGQDRCWRKGNHVISAGYGFPNIVSSLSNRYSNMGQDFKVGSVGPFFLNYEYAVNNLIGIAASGTWLKGHVSWTDRYGDPLRTPDTAGVRYQAAAGTVKVNFHFLRREQFELYAGLGLGYSVITGESYLYDHNPDISKLKVSNARFTPLVPDLGIGARLYFVPFAGIFAQVGYSNMAIVQSGIQVKF